MLVVLQADTVVDPPETAAAREEGGCVSWSIEADQKSVRVGGGRAPPLAEAVLAAVRARQRVRSVEEVDRTGFAVVLREDRRLPTLLCRNPPPRRSYRGDELRPADRRNGSAMNALTTAERPIAIHSVRTCTRDRSDQAAAGTAPIPSNTG